MKVMSCRNGERRGYNELMRRENLNEARHVGGYGDRLAHRKARLAKSSDGMW